MKNNLRDTVSDQIWPHINPIWDHASECVGAYDKRTGVYETVTGEIWDTIRVPLRGHVEVIRDYIVRVPISLI